MAAISGTGAVNALAKSLRRKGDPTDPGPFGDASAELEEVNRALRAYVDQTKKPAKGKVVITIDLKASLMANDEVEVTALSTVKSTKPAAPARKTSLFLDKEGVAHTSPQVELPLFDGLKGVDGGKDEEKGKKKANYGNG